MINKLNDDLRNERKHMGFYLQSSCLIRGLHREELSEYLVEHAKSEFEHIQQFAKVIVGLGGIPDQRTNPYPDLTDAKEILEYALHMENEVVDNYAQRIKDAENLGGSDGVFLGIFLEDQLLDSRTDADHIREMVRG